jgi:hypothetical protein
MRTEKDSHCLETVFNHICMETDKHTSPTEKLLEAMFLCSLCQGYSEDNSHGASMSCVEAG